MSALIEELRERVDGEVRFDEGARGAYSTDASNYRQVPIGVVIPRSVDAAAEAVAVCRRHEVPIVSRGGGTSLAGQATNAAVVLDWTKYCNRLLSVDAENGTCVVEPGIVLDDLNRALAEHGLRYGPEPSTHPNCALGGMIGNNSCGATAQRDGKVVDNIARLEVLLYDGTRFWCGETTDEEYDRIEARGDRRAAIYRSLRRISEESADEIRRRYPDIPRRVSGYNLDSLLPEHHFDVAGALVGSESTLVTVLRAELELVPVLPARSLVVLGYQDVATAADAVPAVLRHDPIALEGVDRYLIHDEQLKQMNSDALEQMPEGAGFLLVQFGGETLEETDRAAQQMLDDLGESEHASDVAFFDDPALEAELWQVRESGLGATAHLSGTRDTSPGWEDSAVHPDDLGGYLRDLRGLYEEFGYASTAGPSLYGHFGQGCVHSRIPFDLTSAEGVATYRRFMDRASDLAVAYGGSFSGEHGDGQARGELLPKMFGEQIMGAFGELKALFDPQNMMNPGKLVAPRRMDEDLRFGATWAPRTSEHLHFAYPEDGGSFAGAAARCVGVGRCRQHSTQGGQVMCPSYQVTGEEEDSTRGRARLLFEMLNGHGDGPITDGWRSAEVRDALDLCLACKGCKSDCPASVDMATYKAEFLAHHYQGRVRPRTHYTMGWLPLLASLVSRTRLSHPVNALGHAPGVKQLALAAAGLEQREIPVFAPQSLQQWWAARPPRPVHDRSDQGGRGEVVLWPDTFTNHFHPEVGRAAVRVLEAAGWKVSIPTEPICCGLTWISTGQLHIAKRVLRRTVDSLADHVRRGGYVVGLEPSCTAVFRSDAPDLLHGDQDVLRLRDQTRTLAEILMHDTPGWQPPQLGRDGATKAQAMAQVHCHQHAVMGWEADAQLLEAAGVEAEHLDSGCCGLAGNFGFTKGHGEVSQACAERVLLPRVRGAEQDTAVLADGFSCRTQVHDLDSGGREAVHLAELLAGGLDQQPMGEIATPARATVSRRASRAAAAAAATATALTLGAAGRHLARRWT